MLDKIAKKIFLALTLAALVLLIFIVIKRDFGQASIDDIRHFLISYVTPITLVGVATFAIYRSRKIDHFFALVILSSIVIPFYLADLYLQFDYFDYTGKIEDNASRYGLELEHRTAKEIVADFRKSNVKSYPFFRVIHDAKNVIPLGNIPESMIVDCNELGRFHIFKSDRHGFNNPDDVWDMSAIDIAILGDSYPHGSCLPNNEKIFANQIRMKFPRLLNLAIGGNNPLLNVMTIKEYVVPMKPKFTLWFHFAGNDLVDLMGYGRNPGLMKYINEDFQQNLMAKRAEIAKELEDFYGERSEQIYRTRKRKPALNSIDLKGLLRLSFLRTALGLTRNLDNFDFQLFKRIMVKAKELTDQIGSQLIFVNIIFPSMALNADKDPVQRQTLSIVSDLGIPVFNFSDRLLKMENYLDAYSYGTAGGHFTELGNSIMADYVMNEIMAK